MNRCVALGPRAQRNVVALRTPIKFCVLGYVVDGILHMSGNVVSASRDTWIRWRRGRLPAVAHHNRRDTTVGDGFRLRHPSLQLTQYIDGPTGLIKLRLTKNPGTFSPCPIDASQRAWEIAGASVTRRGREARRCHETGNSMSSSMELWLRWPRSTVAGYRFWDASSCHIAPDLTAVREEAGNLNHTVRPRVSGRKLALVGGRSTGLTS